MNKKFLLMFLIILVGVIALFWGTFEKTSSNQYCSSCHMMKPESFTWQASSHSQVACVSCHVEPGVLTKVKYKLFSAKEVFAALTGNYGIAITSTTPISDAACTQCHDMNTRKVTPSGDLIIPHDKHTSLNVSCTQCHTGVAHGNIVEQRVTFRTDYQKWDEATGQSIMSDTKNLRPDMDVCINCHKVRNAPLNCSACHTTSMTPSSHKEASFVNGGHGLEAENNILTCDSCHSYMSKEPVEVAKGSGSAFQQFLTKDNKGNSTISASDYAKANTFCKDCHGKRPASHDQDFPQTHGVLASQDKTKCLTCHENNAKIDSPVTKITCASCHPSVHANANWRPGHPIDLPPNPKVTQLCYTCHTQTCAKCHGGNKKGP